MRFAESDNLDVLAPGLIEQRWTEAEALGAAAWLWMHSRTHRDMPVHALPVLLLPAIRHRQFILASEAGKPVFYLGWASLNEDAEQRYLQRHPMHMREADWTSGDRGWILDWIAPFGHTRIMHRLVQRRLFANRCMRSLYHRGDERGLRIKLFQGTAVSRREAEDWCARRPLPDLTRQSLRARQNE